MADTAHSGTSITGGHTNAVASGAAGFMSGADKAKLDGIASGAQVCSAANVQTACAALASALAVNSQKITGLANGSAASDAAAFGQIPLAATATPLIAASTAAVGTGTKWAKEDHVHPRSVTLLAVGAATAASASTSNKFVNLAAQAAATLNTIEAGSTIGALVAGNITTVVINVGTPLTTDTVTFTVRVNGSSSALTGTLAINATSLVLTGSVAVNQGDLISLLVVQSSTQSQAAWRMTVAIGIQ